MGQVALTEGHEEADPLDSRHIERQRFDLLMGEAGTYPSCRRRQNHTLS